VLCERLAYADAERPDLIIDFATLTGRRGWRSDRNFLALFGNDEGVVHELARIAAAEHDPLWPMPLWAGYEDELASKIADLNNVAPSAFAGAIFGALFLKRFVTESAWVHIDLYAWNSKDRPGRGVGAEAQALRGTYRYLVGTLRDCVNFSMPKKSPAIDTRRYSRLVVDGVKQTPSRSMLRAVGFVDADFDKPQVGGCLDLEQLDALQYAHR